MEARAKSHTMNHKCHKQSETSKDFRNLSKDVKAMHTSFNQIVWEGSGFPLWKHKYGDHLRPCDLFFLSSKIPHQQNHKKSKAAVVLFPLLQPLHSQHKLLPPLPPPPPLSPLPPETQKLQSSSTAYSQHRPEHHNTSLVGQWESKAPDCEKAAECPSHQNRPISAYTAGCTARMFCRSISKLIQIESQKEQTRWSSAEVFASTAVKLRAETNLCAG